MDPFVTLAPIAILAICVLIISIFLYFVVRKAVKDGIADAIKAKNI
jgi:hypothetical protein